MCVGSKSKKSDFILEDRTKIPLTLEHEVLGITIDNVFYQLSFSNNTRAQTF